MSSIGLSGGTGYGDVNIQGSRDDLLLSDYERRLFRKFYLNLLHIPKEFETWILDRYAISDSPISASRISGSSLGFYYASVATDESRANSAYGDLATVGPSLTGLPDGSYAVVHGCVIHSAAAGSGIMSYSINGATAADADRCQWNGTDAVSVSTIRNQTLSNTGNNSLVAKYRSSGIGDTRNFLLRFIAALRYLNP